MVKFLELVPVFQKWENSGNYLSMYDFDRISNRNFNTDANNLLIGGSEDELIIFKYSFSKNNDFNIDGPSNSYMMMAKEFIAI